MRIKPLSDQLLVSKEATSDRTAGGLYVPQVAEGKEVTHVRVEAIGPGRTNEAGQLVPHGIEVGDVLILSPFNSAVEVKCGGKGYLLIRANDAIAEVVLDPLDPVV
jgi:chaperonin GroES